jgi:hypothetical protein
VNAEPACDAIKIAAAARMTCHELRCRRQPIQPGESAISGRYHGKGEVGEYLSRLGEKPITLTVRDGKTVAVQVHTDTAMMERVYGKKQVAAG